MHARVTLYTRILILCALFLAPFLYAAIALRSRQKIACNRVLVVPQLTRIGDIVCSTPVFKALATAQMPYEVTVLVSKKAAGIIRHNPHIHRILYLEDYKYRLWALVLEVARLRFVAGVSLSGTAFSSLLFFYGLIPTRIKLVQEERPPAEVLTDFMATHPMRYRNHTFLPAFYLTLLKHLGIREASLAKDVIVMPESRAKVGAFLSDQGVADGEPLVGISITAGNKIKEWGDRNFLILAQKLIEQFKVKIVVLGGPGDKERIDALITSSEVPESIIAAHTFSLEDLPALIARLSLYIAVDTGPIYIAHALRIPLIDIVGPVDPREQPPQDERSLLVVPSPGIQPSSFVFKRPGEPEEHMQALASITPNHVFAAVAKLMARLYS